MDHVEVGFESDDLDVEMVTGSGVDYVGYDDVGSGWERVDAFSVATGCGSEALEGFTSGP